MIAGFVAGVIPIVVRVPSDRVKCMMQVHVMCVGVALHDAGTRDVCGCGFA